MGSNTAPLGASIITGLLMIIPGTAVSQPMDESDRVAAFVKNKNVFNRGITEQDEAAANGGFIFVDIPGLAINFFDEKANSDRLLINPYTVMIRSDLVSPPTEPTNESRLPIALEIASDSTSGPLGSESDVLTVFINGLVSERIPLLEGGVEQVSRGPSFIVSDIGLSDFVDVDFRGFTFASDSEGGGPLPPIPSGYTVENITGIQFTTYELRVSSDVPEPGTLALLGTALLGLGRLRRRTAGGERIEA